MTNAEHTGHATDRARRCVVFLVLACIASGSVLAGTAIGAEAAPTNTGQAEIAAPFAQADDESDDDDDGETRVINITAPGDDVEYTLTAPSLAPGDNLELVNDDDESDAPQEVVDGDTATGVIGNDKYDSYGFTGSIDEVQLESEGIDEIEVRIDGEPVDPRTLTGEDTETITQETATETTTATAAETTTAARETTRATSTDTANTAGTDTTANDTAGTAASTTNPPPSTGATAGSGAQSGQSGFGMVMFVLIGIVSGLILAGALVYVVGSDRFG